MQAEAEAKDEELLAAYRAAILAALRDVETALSALQHLNEQRAFEHENLAQSERAFEGAKLRYQAGSGDFLILLEAQRTMYAARDQEVQYKLARLQALVGLCKALGGGWQAAGAGRRTHRADRRGAVTDHANLGNEPMNRPASCPLAIRRSRRLLGSARRLPQDAGMRRQARRAASRTHRRRPRSRRGE